MKSDIKKISVSIMCADLMNLQSQILELANLGVDYIHVDVTDLHFVKNLTFGIDFVNAMRRVSPIPLDLHFMSDNPSLIFERTGIKKGEILAVHSELDLDLEKFSREVRSSGGLFFLAVNPDTPIETLKPSLGLIDGVLLMLVRPGFAGAKLVDGILDKVGYTRKWLNSEGREDALISVDGSVSSERAKIMSEAGANIFVGGTSGIYRPGIPLEKSIADFRKSL